MEVGFYDTARYPPVRTGLRGGQKQTPHPVTLVALWNEFGTKNIPERPFFRNAIQSMQDPIINILKADVNPKTMQVTMRLANKVGQIGQSEIRRSITSTPLRRQMLSGLKGARAAAIR